MSAAENNPLIGRTQGRTRPGVGIVHLGLGAFFRAHGAIYVAEAMAKQGGDWGITGVSLMRPNQRDLLAPQDCVYTALELGPDGTTPQKIEVIENVLVAPEDPKAVLSAMADPAVKIVTLTVTEKGYCHEPSTGKLNRAHPDIVHDIENPTAPKSVVGYLVAGLARRKAAGVQPFTVLCCDNLPDNGKVVRGVVLELAGLVDKDLADWIAAEVAFPCTMVDRIVPATKPEDIETVAALTGTRDNAPVMHEPFRQWVIEDNFCNDRPDFAAVGVQMVDEVAPFEDMKLRCLNGTHSTLAYLGYLSGYETISDTVADTAFADFCRYLWRAEIIPTLDPPEGVGLGAYADELLTRYQNPSIRHLTWQIAMDGSQKLPQRLLGTIADNLAAGRDCPGLILAVAGWMRYVGGIDEKGQPIDVKDPLADRLATLKSVDDFLAVREVFPTELAGNADFRAALEAAFDQLKTNGARASVEAFQHA